MAGKWSAGYSLTRPSEYHIHPLDDAVAHTFTGADCVCGPRTELHPRGWLIIHHSLDGREHTERPQEPS